ncbi:MAG: 50S ribosomal protein L35 [Candidatus Dadabacteria bacterium]|nr:50S ribosomal protein L35 [Candidatus Dadabacteria bacterium]NIQ13186.1 50S ribosomal protein L35 [Candidatus Dadabacteria bacterium]
MAKIKMKTNRSAAKRFSVSGTGKIKRNRGGKSHINVKKNSKRMRRLLSPEYLEGNAAKKIKTYVPYI